MKPPQLPAPPPIKEMSRKVALAMAAAQDAMAQSAGDPEEKAYREAVASNLRSMSDRKLT
jgi:hypothetical protein